MQKDYGETKSEKYYMQKKLKAPKKYKYISSEFISLKIGE
jgi:hypothetical protein